VHDVIDLVVLNEAAVNSLITDVETCVLAGEVNLLITEVGGNDGALAANFLADGSDERDTDLTVGTSDEDLLAELYVLW
jgi:hypothetical protein